MRKVRGRLERFPFVFSLFGHGVASVTFACDWDGELFECNSMFFAMRV